MFLLGITKKGYIFLSLTRFVRIALTFAPSQEILTDNAEELVIRLHLTPSYDFDQKLLSLGNRVQVIEPQWY